MHITDEWRAVIGTESTQEKRVYARRARSTTAGADLRHGVDAQRRWQKSRSLCAKLMGRVEAPKRDNDLPPDIGSLGVSPSDSLLRRGGPSLFVC
jgi:hypothetical protein